MTRQGTDSAGAKQMAQPTDPPPEHPQPQRLPLERQLPPQVLASPAELPPEAIQENVPWWRPTWRDLLRQTGYHRVVLGLAALLVPVLLGLMFLHPRWVGGLGIAGLKLVALLAAVPVVVIGQLVRRVVRARQEPFCIHCGYSLSGLPDHHRCPECGRPYSFALIDEYRRDPHWFIARWKAQRSLPPRDVPLTAGPRRRPHSSDGTS